MRKALIYCLIDPTDNQIRYIGGTIQKLQRRFTQHICLASRRPCSTLRSSIWIRSLLVNGLKPRIELLYVCDTEDYEYDERIFIIACRALGCDLTNVSDGGELGTSGHVVSQLTRERMSKASKEKALHRDYTISGMSGKTHTEITKLIMSKKAKERSIGVPKSEAHKKAMSDCRKGKPNGRAGIKRGPNKKKT